MVLSFDSRKSDRSTWTFAPGGFQILEFRDDCDGPAILAIALAAVVLPLERLKVVKIVGATP
jgi:hypothetical protein